VSAPGTAGAFEPVTFINGDGSPSDSAHVSVRDRGLTLADGVFETMRLRHGRVFQLEQHVARLEAALVALRIPVPRDIRRWVADGVRAAGANDASVRLTVTRGVGPAGLAPPGRPRPTVLVSVSPMPTFASSVYAEGLRAHVVKGRRNPKAATAGLKTLSYTDAVVALIEAQEQGADEALFLDVDEHCSEASASNLFFLAGSTLVTPPLSCGALAGITRASVMALASQAAVDVQECECTLDDLLAAREAFLTSSLRGVAPLVSVNGRLLGNGMPGIVTTRLSALHAELVERECAAEN